MLITIFHRQIHFSQAWHALWAGKYLPC